MTKKNSPGSKENPIHLSLDKALWRAHGEISPSVFFNDHGPKLYWDKNAKWDNAAWQPADYYSKSVSVNVFVEEIVDTAELIKSVEATTRAVNAAIAESKEHIVPKHILNGDPAQSKRGIEQGDLFEQSETKQIDPPLVGDFILSAILPPKRREAALGDLNERFAKECAVHGESRARWRYWGRVMYSVGPLLWRGLKKMRGIALLIAARKFFLG